MLSNKRPGHPTKRPDIETLNNLYEVKSAREIAAMYGVAEVTVRAWIARYRKDLEQQKSAGEK